MLLLIWSQINHPQFQTCANQNLESVKTSSFGSYQDESRKNDELREHISSQKSFSELEELEILKVEDKESSFIDQFLDDLQDSRRILLSIENSEQILIDELEECFPGQIDEEQQQVLSSINFDESHEMGDFIEENNFENDEMVFAEPGRFSVESKIYCEAAVNCYWTILPRVGKKCLCQQYYSCH